MPRLKPLKLVLAGVDKISAPVTRISRRIEKMQRPIRAVTARMRTLDRVSGLKRMRGALMGIGTQLASLARSAALFGTIFVAAGAKAVISFVNATDEIAKTADFAGIGVEALQEYRFAFDRAGVSQEKTDKGLIKLGKTIGELRAGSGTLFTILQKTNTEFLQQLVAAENAEEAFDLLINKLATTENHMDRAALSAAAFGRTGQLMANALKDGIEPFNALIARARELGFVLDEETVRKGEVAKDVFTDIGAVMKGLALSIGGDALPAILELSQGFLAWSMANRDLLKQNLVGFVEQLIAGFRQFIEIMREVMPVIKATVDFLGGMGNVVKILATVILAKLIWAVGVFGIALMATPVGWFLAFLAAVAAGAHAIIKNWEPLKLWWEEFWAGLKRGIASFANAVPDFIRTRLGFDSAETPGATPGAGNALGPRGAGAAALLSPGGANTFAGKLDVSISQDRPPRVERFEGSSPDFDLGVETGLTLLPGF